MESCAQMHFLRSATPVEGEDSGRLPRELTSGPEKECRCLRGDSPLLGSGRNTGSYETQKQREVSQSGAEAETAKDRAPLFSQPGA